MTLAFFTGLLAGLAIAWVWYVIGAWLDSRPERVELDDAWVGYSGHTDATIGDGDKVTYRRIP